MTPARLPESDRPRTSLDSPLGLLGQTETFTRGAVARELLDAAPKTRCPNTYGLFVLSAEKGKAFPLTCSRWDCPNPGCGGLKREAAREAFTGGTEQAWDRGEQVRLMTLTSLPGTTHPEFQAGVKRSLLVLRKRGFITEYGGAIERTVSGLPHAHLLITGTYIPQRELSRIARGGPTCRTRLGEVVDIRAVRNIGPRSAVSDYLLKQQTAGELARYVSKAATEQARAARALEGVTRQRPIRLSRGWYPGGLGAAVKVVRRRWSDSAEPVTATDWAVVRRDPESGYITVLNAPKRRIEPVNITGYRVVTENGAALLRAA